MAGTITTLATIDLGLEHEEPEAIDGHVLTQQTIERLLAELAARSPAELLEVRGLMAARARPSSPEPASWPRWWPPAAPSG